jgi:tRNA/rRNA methyltransferase
MTSPAVDPARVAIVLVGTKVSENVGSTARAMANLGFSRLVLVAPKNLDLNRAAMTATRGGLDILLSAQTVETLEQALAPFSFVVGTTARKGGYRKTCLNPGQMAANLVSLARQNEVAIVFGPEDKGLANEDLKLCHAFCTIPTAGLSSLNVAQAVLLLLWEMTRPELEKPPAFSPKLAKRQDLEGMYVQLTEVLARIGFINPDNPDHWIDNLRRSLSRIGLTARDVKIVRGIFRQMDWYIEKQLSEKSEKKD